LLTYFRNQKQTQKKKKVIENGPTFLGLFPQQTARKKYWFLSNSSYLPEEHIVKSDRKRMKRHFDAPLAILVRCVSGY